MRKLKEHVNGLLLCLFELITGILLLIDPVGFTTGIITGAGVILLLTSLFNIIKYFTADAVLAARGQLLTFGLIGLTAGLFCVCNSGWFLTTFPVLTMIYGIVILFTGFSKIQLTVDLLRLRKGKWYWAAINAAVSILCGITVLGNPFTTTSVLWIFTGCSLIVEAVIDAVTWVLDGRVKKDDGPIETFEGEIV